jgi:hypothetical protein
MSTKRKTVVNKMVIVERPDGRFEAVHVWRKRKVTLAGPGFAGYATQDEAAAAAEAKGYWTVRIEF